MIWLERHRPELLDRADDCLPLKDWLYFRLTGERVHGSLRGELHLRRFPHARDYDEAVLAAMGIATRRPAAADRRRHAASIDPLTDGGREGERPAAGTAGRARLCRRASARGSAAASTTSRRRPACSIFGSTGMHMRFVPDCRRGAAEPGPQRLHDGAFRCPARRRRCSRTWRRPSTSTGCSASRARRPDCWAHDFDRDGALRAFEDAVIGRAGPGALPSLYLRAGERGPFLDPNARAQFVGLSNARRLRRLVRSVYEGLAFAARDCYAAMGGPRRRVRLAGGAARSPVLRRSSPACSTRRCATRRARRPAPPARR